MIEINGNLVAEHYEEYAVEPEAGVLVECDELYEAENISAQMKCPVLRRHVYISEWSDGT